MPRSQSDLSQAAVAGVISRINMKPYYEDESVQIYHGDCRELLPLMPKVDLVLTDPPYGIGLVQKSWAAENNGKQASVVYEDEPEYIRGLIHSVIPLALEQTERAIIFPGPSLLWEYPPARTLGCVYVPSGAGRAPWGFQCSHPILYYGKDPYLVAGLGGRANAFESTKGVTENIDHPCPKPVEWMRWAVNRGSVDATDTILDPFMGSGTTLRAAKDLGRKAIGIEIEERYCEIAAKRMSQLVLI